MSGIEIAKRSASGSLVLFIGNILSTILLGVSAIIIARLLGPDGYGAYALVLLIPGVFQQFLGIGVDVAMTQSVAFHVSRGEEEAARRITRNAMSFLILMGLGLTTATYLSAIYLTPLILHRTGLETLVQYASLLVLAQTLLQSSLVGFTGWKMMKYASATSVIQALLRLFIAPWLIFLGFGVLGALVANVASILFAGAIGFVALYLLAMRKQSGAHRRFLSDTREMISYGFPVYLGNTISGLSLQYVTSILAAVAVNTVVGNFQAASNITVAIVLTSSSLVSALFPAFASLEGLKADTATAFKYSVKYVGFICMPVIFFLVGAALPLVQFLLTSFYLSSVAYLQLLALAFIPVVVRSVTITYFNAIRRTRMTMLASLGSAGSLLVLAPLLSIVAGLGVYGLIYSIMISNTVGLVVSLSSSALYLGIRVDLKPLGAIIGASAVSALITGLANTIHLPSLGLIFLDVPLFAMSYLTLVPLLRGIGTEDITRLRISVEGLGLARRIAGPILGYEQYVLKLFA